METSIETVTGALAVIFITFSTSEFVAFLDLFLVTVLGMAFAQLSEEVFAEVFTRVFAGFCAVAFGNVFAPVLDAICTTASERFSKRLYQLLANYWELQFSTWFSQMDRPSVGKHCSPGYDWTGAPSFQM